MVTNLSGTLSPTSRHTSEGTAAQNGLVGLTLNRLYHLWCGLHGHDPLLQIDQNRMYLRCASCGYESSGWDVGPHSRRRVRRDPVPFASQPRLVSMRKVA